MAKKKKSNEADYFQSTFDILIRCRAMLSVNLSVQAELLSILKKTDAKKELKGLLNLSDDIAAQIRAEIFGKEGS